MVHRFKNSLIKVLKDWKSYLTVLTGAIILSLGVNLFLVPNRIAAGGLTGMATVIYHLSGMPVGTLMLLLNIPLFLLGIKILGRNFGVKTLFATVTLSLAIDLLAPFLGSLTDDLLLASIFGGLLVGLGLGLVLKQDASTGGTDLGAKIIHKVIPYISVGQLLLVIDALVVLSAAIVFRNYELGLYAAITLFITSRVIDTVIVGVNYTKAVHIISDNPGEISKKLVYEMNHGMTSLKGKGMYTGKEKNILLCIIRRRDLPHLKSVVSQIDKNAFIFVTDVREVLGEGFSSHV
ncbi:MAG: YitT family protein [Spirochaetaceae bacterium]|nr:YitT family protein [Spirochaetaceae bacterium]